MKPSLAGAAADRLVSATAAHEPPMGRARGQGTVRFDVVDQCGQPRQESEDEADQLDSREIEQ